MPYDSKAVANYFIDLATKEKVYLDPLKLQKLIYFAHGWHLAIYDKPLLLDQVEAWQFGPVIPDIYHEFKSFGSNRITRRAAVLTFADEDGSCFIQEPTIKDSETAKLLQKVWDVYKAFDSIQLSQMTHQAGSPWSITREKTGGRKNADIPDDLIKADFLRQARESTERSSKPR